jgi:hypothetical protein
MKHQQLAVANGGADKASQMCHQEHKRLSVHQTAKIES